MNYKCESVVIPRKINLIFKWSPVKQHHVKIHHRKLGFGDKQKCEAVAGSVL